MPAAFLPYYLLRSFWHHLPMGRLPGEIILAISTLNIFPITQTQICTRRRNRNERTMLRCLIKWRLCDPVHICPVWLGWWWCEYFIPWEEGLSLLFNSIRQLLSFNGYCWERWITVVSMVTPTCGGNVDLHFVKTKDKDARCGAGSGRLWS